MKTRGNNVGRIDCNFWIQLNKESVCCKRNKKSCSHCEDPCIARSFLQRPQWNFRISTWRELFNIFGAYSRVRPVSNWAHVAFRDCDQRKHMSHLFYHLWGIRLTADKMTSFILEEIRKTKYFSIILNSSPEISRVDQMTFVSRYVREDGSSMERC
jgi:hypothetical protein